MIFVISHFGFEGWSWVLIASVPDLCILFTFISSKVNYFTVDDMVVLYFTGDDMTFCGDVTVTLSAFYKKYIVWRHITLLA